MRGRTTPSVLLGKKKGTVRQFPTRKAVGANERASLRGNVKTVTKRALRKVTSLQTNTNSNPLKWQKPWGGERKK